MATAPFTTPSPFPSSYLTSVFDSSSISLCHDLTSDPSMATAPYCFPSYPPPFSSYPAPLSGFYPSPVTTQIPNHPPPAARPVHGDLYHAPPAFPCPISASVHTPATFPAYDNHTLLLTTTSTPNFSPALTFPYSQVHAPPPESTAISAQPWVASQPTGDTSTFVPPPSPPTPAPGPWTPPPPPSGAPSSSTSGTPPFPPVQGVPYSSVALHDQARSLLLQDSEVDAFQRHCLARLPSSPTTNEKDAAVLSHSRLDSAPEVFGEMPTPAIDSRAQQNGDLSSTRAASNNHCSRGSPSPSSAYGKDEQVPAKVAIHHRLQHELRSIQARIDQQQARERTALNALQGELAKLKSAASMLAVAMGMQTAESPVTGSSPGSMVTAASATSMLCAAPSSSVSDSTVPAAHANVAPQVLEEMPQSYGLHNLTQRTVFRADGSEHRYYALTDTYPSERVVPEPVFSVYDDKSDGCAAESVHVFTNTPEQLTDGEDQHENSQALKLSSKPIFSPERPTTGTGYVFSWTNEQTPKAEHVKQQQVNNQQWNRLMTEIGRKEWDPGTLQTILDVPAVVKWWSSFEGLIDAVTSSSNILSMIVCAAPSFPNMLVNLLLSILWDPGEHTILSSRQNMVSVQDFTNHVQLVLSTSSRETTKHCLTYQELKANYLREVATLTWHGSITGSPSILLSSTTYTWDPGVLNIISMMLDKCLVPHQTWDNYLCSLYCNSVLRTEYCQMSQVWVFSIRQARRLKWDPGVQLTLDSWLDVLTVWSAMVKSFSGTHGPDLVTWQSQMTSAYLWDTGSMLRQYKFIWLPNGSEFRDGQLTYMVQSPTPNFSELVRPMVTVLSCWLPSFEIKAKLQWDPGIAISFCMDSWLEMTAVKTLARLQRTLLTYWQCQLPMRKNSCSEHKFLSQQGLQKKYNTKNLLSSQNYLQIWEMDIIFITFLPP